jgi:hypothetical protein
MYWAGEVSFAVADAISAERWLHLLLNFLRLQRRAAKQRRWPNLETWAHGNPAAACQLHAERAATKLGPDLRAALDARDLTAYRDGDGTLRALMNGRPVFSVWRSPNRFDRRRHRLRCACEIDVRGRRRTCQGQRAQLLEELAYALVMWEIEEQKFWACYQDRACCGTIDNCPLRNNSGGSHGTTV